MRRAECRVYNDAEPIFSGGEALPSVARALSALNRLFKVGIVTTATARIKVEASEADCARATGYARAPRWQQSCAESLPEYELSVHFEQLACPVRDVPLTVLAREVDSWHP